MKGALIEAGIALGMGKPVVCCLPGVDIAARSCRPIGSWINHPMVSRQDNIRIAILPLGAESIPCWEVVSDEDLVMHHVRWSMPNVRGEYFMCAHYPQLHFAESQAKRWNEEGKSPYEFREFARTQ